jgi:hypothetical protein
VSTSLIGMIMHVSNDVCLCLMAEVKTILVAQCHTEPSPERDELLYYQTSPSLLHIFHQPEPEFLNILK